MEVIVSRCAGLDVHKNTVMACVRVPGPNGGRTSDGPPVPHVHRRAAPVAGLVGRRAGQPGGDGGDRGVLETGLARPGRDCRAGVDVGQRACGEEHAGPQDRRRRRGMAGRAGRVRAAAAQLRAAAGDRAAAGPDPLPQEADRGTGPRDPADPEAARRRRDQAGLGRVGHPRGLGPADAGGVDRRGAGRGRAGRVGPHSDAAQDPAAAAGPGRPLRRPSRADAADAPGTRRPTLGQHRPARQRGRPGDPPFQ